eukprot:m.448279 g.448279  ORF g.448279 m.448279 type:complete len:141 (-) comp56891_c0_seq5:1037-1459(-)
MRLSALLEYFELVRKRGRKNAIARDFLQRHPQAEFCRDIMKFLQPVEARLPKPYFAGVAALMTSSGLPAKTSGSSRAVVETLLEELAYIPPVHARTVQQGFLKSGSDKSWAAILADPQPVDGPVRCEPPSGSEIRFVSFG